MSAHDTQIGGDHYKKKEIQPWDAIDAFNAVINKLAPVSYSPGKFAAIVKLEKQCSAT